MSEELKPCPFCGSEATNQRFAPNDGKPYATCGNTECSMHNVGMRYEGWNTRHIPEGYALVPVEPSDAIIQAMRNYWFGTTSALIMKPQDCIELYKKMIADVQESE